MKKIALYKDIINIVSIYCLRGQIKDKTIE